MKIRMGTWVVAALALAACRPHDAKTGCNANDNPIDGALCPEFESAGYQPQPASDTELCTRLAVDMLGARPTRDEIPSRCAGEGAEPTPPSGGGGAYGPMTSVDPMACDVGHSCRSTLLGPASIDFHANGRTQPIPVDELTAEDWQALRAPGRLFVTIPMFWEA